MSELTKEEFEKEFERLSDELCKSLNKPHLPCSPHTIPTPIAWKKISDEYLKKEEENNEGKENIISKMQFSTFAMLTNGIVTYGMKRSFGRERPNGSCCQSFPSGHTSHSFTIAAIAHELYGESVGILAYGLATLVAVSRINDNKHYLSDVLFGAALGSTVGRAFALNYNEIEDNIVITPYMQLKFTFPL